MNFKTALCYMSLLSMILSCSDETIEKPLSLRGQVKGRVLLQTEFGTSEAVQSGASVSLEGEEPPINSLTDEDGKYILENVPTGTYRFVVEKEGFTTYRSQVFGIMGGNEPLYSSFLLRRPATSYMENLTGAVNTGGPFSISGNVVHHGSGQQYIRFVAFYHNTPDVSPDNYLDAGNLFVYCASGSEYSWDKYFFRNVFPSGSTVYVVVYAYSLLGYDTLLGKYTYSGLGEPSDVLSIQIP